MTTLRSIFAFALVLSSGLAAGCPMGSEVAQPDTVDIAAEIDATVTDVTVPLPFLRVATYNVRRFFDTVCDSGRCGSGDFEEVLTPSAFAARADRLAAAILGLDADIVILQEIENEACLDALLARVAERLPAGVIGEAGWPASLDVAVLGPSTPIALARHGGERLTRADGTPTSFSREFLEVHFEVDGRRVIVFAAHFKSKANDDPGRRLAEAEAARAIIDRVAAVRPGAIILLGGDLNDTPGSPPLLALEEGGGLVALTADLPPEDAWTVTYAGQRLLIDHLHLPPSSAAAYLPNTVRTMRDPGRTGYGGSDHAAVRAVLSLGDGARELAPRGAP